MIFQGKARYPVREAILHCAAINTGQFKGLTPFQAFREVNRWHVQRGFSGFGYHGLIMPDGAYWDGRPFDQIGAHCLERNRGSLGFLLIESVKITHIGDFSDWFTASQRVTLKTLLREIPGLSRVSGHNDYAQKLCPGFRVLTEDWLQPVSRGFPASGDNFVTLNG